MTPYAPGHTIWIDRTTGTWGKVNDLILVDPDAQGQEMDPEGDDLTCIAFLESTDSDSDIIQVAEDAYADGSGMRLRALLDYYGGHIHE